MTRIVEGVIRERGSGPQGPHEGPREKADRRSGSEAEDPGGIVVEEEPAGLVIEPEGVQIL